MLPRWWTPTDVDGEFYLQMTKSPFFYWKRTERDASNQREQEKKRPPATHEFYLIYFLRARW